MDTAIRSAKELSKPLLTATGTTGIFLLILVMTLVAPRVRKLFFPPSDRSQFLIDFYLSEGSDYRETRDQALIVEKYLLANYPNEIRNTALYIGEQGPRFEGGVSGEQRTSNYAQFVVNNHSFKQTQKMVGELSAYFRSNFTDAIGIVKYLESGPPVGAPIQVRVYGKEFKKLYAYANQVQDICESIDGIRDVRDDWGLKIPKLSISINQDQARRVGVSTASIAQAFQRALTGEAITFFREGGSSRCQWACSRCGPRSERSPGCRSSCHREAHESTRLRCLRFP